MSDGIDSLLRTACQWSPAAWFEGFGKIERKGGELVRPTANIYQRRISEVIEYAHSAGRPCRLVCLKPRQKGSSTFSVAALYRRLHAKRGRGLIAGGAHFQGSNLFKILRTYADNDDLDPKSVKVMDAEARYKNGSTIERITLANPNAGRSGTYQAVILTEVAYLQDEGVANSTAVLNGLLKCVPYEPDTLIIQESTAKGAQGDFYDTWQSGISFEDFKAGKNGSVRIFAAWFEFDDSRMDPASEGIGDASDLTETEETLVVKWGLSLDQVAWMRWAIREECRGDFDRFLQDYPFDSESCFLRSGQGRFGSAGIEWQKEVARMTVPKFGVLEYNERADRVSFRPTEEREARVVMFEGPRDRCRYLAVCDPATGDSQTSGTDPDSNSYGVMRDGFVSADGRWNPPRLAMRNICYYDGPRFGNWFDTHIVEEELWKMARYYGNCPIVVEVNKDRGLIELLKLRGDANIYQREMFNRREQVMMSAYGWETNDRTREMIVSGLAQVLRESGDRGQRAMPGHGIEIPCPWAVAQLGNFVTKPSGRSEAAKGKHDDDVLMLAMGRQCLGQATPFFEEKRSAWVPDHLRVGQKAGRSGSKECL